MSWALTLAAGGLGGWVFHLLSLPLPWMLGSMAVVITGAIARQPVAVPGRLRQTMLAVLGLMLGSTFTPSLWHDLARWSVSLGALAAYVVAVGLLALWWLKRLGYDPVTSYFAAAPGGINEMVLSGTAAGGDGRTIALIHALRIVLVVSAVPLSFRAFGVEPAAAPPLPHDLSWIEALLLAGAGLAGAVAGLKLRLPAAVIMGPMLASAALHVGGVTDAQPPGLLVAAAQVVAGAGIGCRFKGFELEGLLRGLKASGAVTAIFMAGAAAFAWTLSGPTGLPWTALLLAVVPGGLAEMCLVSLALGLDVAFVSTHHLLRIVLVLMLAPAVFRLMRRTQTVQKDG